MKLRDAKRGINRWAWLWAHRGDQSKPHNVIDFTMGLSREGPREFLTGHQGYL